MNIIIAVLLYLNVISSPGTYKLSEINDDINANTSRIQQVTTDAKLLHDIMISYQKQVSSIWILDDSQMK
jgi:hypothetical protein